MAKLTSYEIIEINATVIIGLLILLTLQSFVPPAIETEITTYLQNVYEADIKERQILEMLDKCNLFKEDHSSLSEISKEATDKFLERCVDLEFKAIESKVELNQLHSWGLDSGYVDEDFYQTDYVLYVTTGGAIISSAINFFMMLPFAFSAMTELISNYIRKDETNHASRASRIMLIIGFCGLIIGVLAIVLNYYFSSLPPEFLL